VSELQRGAEPVFIRF